MGGRIGIILLLLAGIFWSTQGLAIRLMQEADAWQILFYRSISLTVFLGLYLTIFVSKSRSSGRPQDRILQAVGGLSLAGAYLTSILAFQQTSVASAVILFATTPIFVAVLASLLLAEKTGLSTWVSITVVLIGIGVIQLSEIRNGGLSGNFWALAAALLYSAFTIILRFLRTGNPIQVVFISGIMATVACAAWIALTGSSFVVSTNDLILALGMGVFQVGAGLLLYSIAAKHVPAVQLALLPLIEIVLSPIWVAIWIKEIPTVPTIIGCGIVVAAIVGHSLTQARATKRNRT